MSVDACLIHAACPLLRMHLIYVHSAGRTCVEAIWKS